ncbi:hypothetical protein BGZ93_009556 [Podila epicladia]|nr:hypothetical protein BGZ93_009556 [Podila epicladia]KAG0089998.1 hypothetical protein BGZ92_003841 [Podila epicladia]
MSSSNFSGANLGTSVSFIPKRVRREQLLAQNKPTRTLGKWKTTSQLKPAEFCDYLGQVLYFQHEMAQSGSETTTLLMTDYTEHDSLPFSDKDNRPIGKASLVVTLWDEHARVSVQMGVAPGQYLLLKNLVPRYDMNGVIQLSMHGFRPNPNSRAYRIPDPITILSPQDSLVQPLRLRKSRYELDLAALNQEPPPEPDDPVEVKREPSIAPTATLPEASTSNTSMVLTVFAPAVKREQSLAPLSTHPTNPFCPQPSTESVTASTLPMEASSSSAPSATTSNEPELNPARNIQGSISLIAVKEQPSEPAPAAFRSSPNPQDDSPTEVLVDRLRQEQRNSRKQKPYELQFLRMKAKVAGFRPTDINHFSMPECASCGHRYDPASAGNLPKTCPQCSIANRVKYVHRFTLNLVDEFDQGIMVSVEDKDAKTLLGIDYDAMNMSKDSPRKEKLLERLSQIGVYPGKHDSAASKLLDCCIRISKTRDSVEHKDKNEGHDIPQEQQQDEVEPSAGKKRKVSESSTSDNKMHEPFSSNPKKPKANAHRSKSARSTVATSSSGLYADYQASLVFTAIK